MSGKAGVPWGTVRRQLVDEDIELAVELEEISAENEIARQIFEARLERGMTQEERVSG